MGFLQLFSNVPPKSLLIKLLKCYGLNDLNDIHEFTKMDLKKINTVEKLEELIPQLVLYYIPCKAKVYLNNIDEKRAITILKQILSLYNYSLSKRECIYNRKKIVNYSLQNIDLKSFNMDNRQVTISLS